MRATEGLTGGFKEWVCALRRVGCGMGGWVGLRNGWMGVLQKLITVLGRFDTYRGGVYTYAAYEVNGFVSCLLLRLHRYSCHVAFWHGHAGRGVMSRQSDWNLVGDKCLC